MDNSEQKRFVVRPSDLPNNYPTHKHEAYFWECLGRTVATFGFLEEVLVKAIFAFTATTEYSEDKIVDAYVKWPQQLERSVSDQLGGLINTYGKAVKNNQEATVPNIDDLLDDLRKASKTRNVLCHGSWRTPNENGASTPFFVNRQQQRFDTAIDVAFLQQLQKHVSALTCAVVSSVTHMGWQFPGSSGPGKVIWGN